MHAALPIGLTASAAASLRAVEMARLHEGWLDILAGKFAGREKLSVKQAAEVLGLSPRMVRMMCEEALFDGAVKERRDDAATAGSLEFYGNTGSRVVKSGRRHIRKPRERTRWVLTKRGLMLWIAENITTTPSELLHRVAGLFPRLGVAHLRALAVILHSEIQGRALK